MAPEITEKLNLVERLVEEILVVLDNLDADHLASVQVEALYRLGEGGRSKVLFHLAQKRETASRAYARRVSQRASTGRKVGAE
eukprot:scaffold64461_cov35-Tisochrysis_lutea.AAC.2